MPHYPQNTSLRAKRLDSFRQQMADFARAERLRDLREARHLSQEDAAHEIGVTVRSLRAWEKGGGIRWANAKSAATFYGVDPESLVSREQGEDDEGAPERPADVELHQEIAALRMELLAELAAAREVQEAVLRRLPPEGYDWGESRR